MPVNLLPLSRNSHRLLSFAACAGRIVQGAGYRFGVAVQKFQDLPRETRVPLLLLATPLVFGGGASGAYYLRLHHVCDQMTGKGLPRVAAPERGKRLLIIAPHCDDETLGAGGLIADARKRGAEVQVVFLTNGDAFPVAAGRQLGVVKPGPRDLVRFAEHRQTEALRALQSLGVPDRNVTFLGYPDQGLKPLWETYWTAQTPFRSPFTRQTTSPYARSLTPGVTYCGASVVGDLGTALSRFRPTDILVTHPADDHPDHSTAAAFAQAALSSRRQSGEAWAQDAKLHYYLVHRGDWPLPQGYHPDRALLPPPGMLHADTRWSLFELSDEARLAKQNALGAYTSQTSICGRFLNSFVRTTELVADLPPADALTLPDLPTVALGPASPRTPRVAKDAVGDNVARFADASADVTGLDVHRDGDALRVRLRARGVISPRVRYRLRIRVAADDTLSSRYLNVDVPAQPTPSNAHAAEIRLPLHELSLPTKDTGTDAALVWISAETRWRAAEVATPVDCTGYRPFEISL